VDLGADVVHIDADDLVAGLEEAVRRRGANHVVLPYHETPTLQRLFARPLVDQLIERLPAVEIHVVGAADKER
jgi:K+-sensing histidine kinase KdpD